MPLVSVAIPSYNHEKYISEAIESVLNQTFTDLELIIIDDASHDKSPEIIEYYQKRDNRIRAFFHEQNLGTAKTLNDIIEKARGKYIAFFASDDVWFKDKLQEQIKILDKNDNLVIWNEGLIINEEGNSQEILINQMNIHKKLKKSGDIFKELIIKSNFIFATSVIVKKDFLTDVRFNEKLRYFNDYKFALDLAANHEYYFITNPLSCYRIHGKNTINSDEVGWNLDRAVCNLEILNDYGDNLSNYIKNFILLDTSLAYYKSCEKNKALNNIKNAVLSKPLQYNLIYLLLASIPLITRIIKIRYLSLIRE
jgi:glycosyltransferase involved in cell wall biosynthesis